MTQICNMLQGEGEGEGTQTEQCALRVICVPTLYLESINIELEITSLVAYTSVAFVYQVIIRHLLV